MADIDTYLSNIQSAVYGEEVRSAIHDSIEAINEQVETATTPDTTLTQSGVAADAKAVGDEISGLKSDFEQLEPGLSDAAKTALLACFEHVAWVDEQGQAYYDALYDALYDNSWIITNALTNCVSNNSSSSVIKGNSYTATLTANTGYSLTGATVSVTMGGADVTSQVYSNGVISIASVTGDVVITVSAVTVQITSISAVYTQSGSVYTDDTLSVLGDDLVVTATYSDSSTAVIPIGDYTLSGTLSEGTSTITVTVGAKTTTFSVTVTNALERVAYGTYTYRDLFVTNNFITIGNFDGITLSSETQTLSNGDTYRANNGSPEISTEAHVTGTSSLKVTDESTSSQVNYKSTRLPESATFLMAACVRVDSYTSGNVGMQVNVSNAGLSASGIGFVYQNAVTSGFAEIVKVANYSYSATDYPSANLNVFIGDYNTGKADAYIDACVVTEIPSGMTLSEAQQLYHEYIEMVS